MHSLKKTQSCTNCAMRMLASPGLADGSALLKTVQTQSCFPCLMSLFASLCCGAAINVSATTTTFLHAEQTHQHVNS